MLSKIIEQDLEAYKEMCTRWIDEPDGSKRQTAECEKMDQGTCISYSRPYAWFRLGGCPLCSIQTKGPKNTAPIVNALKASKRAARGK
jgi:hypothetical protein